MTIINKSDVCESDSADNRSDHRFGNSIDDHYGNRIEKQISPTEFRCLSSFTSDSLAKAAKVLSDKACLRFLALLPIVIVLAFFAPLSLQASSPSSIPTQAKQSATFTHDSDEQSLWDTSKPFYLNNLYLNCPAALAEKELNLSHDPDETDGLIVSGGAVLRMMNKKVVNLSVTGNPGEWKLIQNGQVYASIGDLEKKVVESLGKPYAIYGHKQKLLKILFYSSAIEDLGLIIIDNQVAGIMFAEPGMLANTLLFGGFYVETTPTDGTEKAEPAEKQTEPAEKAEPAE